MVIFGVEVASNPSPIDQPETWNYAVIAGQQSPGPPGYCIVSGAGTPRKIDIKDGHGQSGASVTYSGDKISEFTITFYLYETSDWNTWWSFRLLFAKPPAGAKPTALPIYHPALSALGIDAVLVKEEHQPEPEGDPQQGVWKVAVDFVQFRPPVAAIATPQGAQQGADTNPQPQDAADKEIARLTSKVAALAGS